MTNQEREYIELVADRAAMRAVEKYAETRVCLSDKRIQDVEKYGTHLGWIKLAIIALFTAVGALGFFNYIPF